MHIIIASSIESMCVIQTSTEPTFPDTRNARNYEFKCYVLLVSRRRQV